MIDLDRMSIKEGARLTAAQLAEHNITARERMAKLKALYSTMRELGATRGQSEGQFIAKMRELERRHK